MAKRVQVDSVEPDPQSGEVQVESGKKEHTSHKLKHAESPKKEFEGKTHSNPMAAKAKFKESLTEPTTDEEILKASRPSVLSAFFAFPEDAHFAGEQDDEEIILLMRAHIVTTLPWVIGTVILLVLPIILLPIFGVLGTLAAVGYGMTLSLILFWYMGVFTFAFLNFLFWYFNVYIVTNQRIVDVDWYSLVNREVNISQISKIQDITANQIGVISGLFDFGHVFIQTAGTEPNFEFHNVPHPQLVARKIQELLEAATEGE